MINSKPLYTALIASMILVGCGGDSNSNNNSNDEKDPAPTSPTPKAPDTEAPVINQVLSTDQQGLQARQITVIGRATDNEELKSVSITTGEGTSAEGSITETGFTVAVEAKPGVNDYTVTLTDASGNSTTTKGSFYFGHRLSAGGAHSGLIKDGKTYTWGRNNLGQLGLGNVTKISENTDENPNVHPLTPQLLNTPIEFVSLAFNQNASIALDVNGNVWGWGDGDDGQLGLGTADDGVVDETDYSTPQKIANLDNVVAVERGYDHTLVLKNDGTVLAFGDNSKGQLGDGTTDDKDTPVTVNGLSGIVQIAASSATSYAIDDQGRLWAWGRNNYGELANGQKNSDPHTTPTQVTLNEPVISIAAGKAHALALVNTGQVYGWGLNSSSQIGLQESETWERYILSPQLLPWFNDAIGVWANGNQSFAQRTDGKVYPWGQNMLGTLGIEQDDNVEKPESPIFGLENVADLGNGALHTLALRQDGKAFAWGWSFEGSLGGGDSTIHRWGYRLPILIKLPETPAE